MEDPAVDLGLAQRLKEARKRAGFADATTAAKHFRWVVPTYLGHENGSRRFGLERARVYARAFNANPAWLLTGEGSPQSTVGIPISGYVGAGAVIYPIDESMWPAGLEEVDLPPGVYSDYAAFKVRGDSNYPAYRHNDIIFVKKDGGPAHEYVNRECVVETEDGRRLLKTVTLGSKKGHYTLVSFNAPPLPDERVVWAAPVVWTHKP
jgi:phage repressor protein C with HTH and peptisase S24 domain